LSQVLSAPGTGNLYSKMARVASYIRMGHTGFRGSAPDERVHLVEYGLLHDAERIVVADLIQCSYALCAQRRFKPTAGLLRADRPPV